MLFWDEGMTQPVSQTLYQREGEHTLYVDADFTTALQIVPRRSTTENIAAELPVNQVFSREHTLYLIDVMREHLLKDEAELPGNLTELNKRIKMARGKKRSFWQEVSEKLKNQFQMQFDVDRVARKWTTLEDGYKKAVDNNTSTGKGPTKFQFYKEMGELLGGQHDIDFPVVGTSKGITVRRPEAIKPMKQPLMQHDSSNEEGELSSPTAQSSDSEGTSTSRPPFAQKRKRGEETVTRVITCFKECEEAAQRRHEEMMEQIKTTNALFKQMLQNVREQQ
ncbi:uncharacterized protein LOC132901097 [Neoarius graeffei]|nr:uncharacterized protein LOC132869064 [Neoarius graeffei]XP_060776858.1 uncharacterized protein LOC132886330 [Neoarius graeffei]XP_060799444.1 uncharacterized protein LOC132901097 [Neoarius graeffei]